jgi:hypothetical protein
MVEVQNSEVDVIPTLFSLVQQWVRLNMENKACGLPQSKFLL